MRTFYIFYINEEFKILNKENPYNLFKALEQIYYLDKEEISLGVALFETIAIPFDLDNLNKFVFDNYKDNDFYTNNRNTHKIYNKYRDETLLLKTSKTYMQLKTNIRKSDYLKNIAINNNLFVCDFHNKDYFWIDKILTFNS